jgi:hypothetical protein
LPAASRARTATKCSCIRRRSSSTPGARPWCATKPSSPVWWLAPWRRPAGASGGSAAAGAAIAVTEAKIDAASQVRMRRGAAAPVPA